MSVAAPARVADSPKLFFPPQKTAGVVSAALDQWAVWIPPPVVAMIGEYAAIGMPETNDLITLDFFQRIGAAKVEEMLYLAKRIILVFARLSGEGGEDTDNASESGLPFSIHSWWPRKTPSRELWEHPSSSWS